MEADAPPVSFTLRPHHLNLLVMITLIYKHFDRLNFSPIFLLRIHEIIICQISETVRPKTHAEIMDMLNKAATSDNPVNVEYVTAVSAQYQDFMSVDRLTSFMSLMSLMIQDVNGGSDDTDLHRRSYYGYFCRRCMVAFLKLSFAGASKLREDHHEWLLGNSGAGYDPTDKEPEKIGTSFDTACLMKLKEVGDTLWKTTADESEWASSDAYSQFERALAINDSNIGNESIRKFFEQHFHEGTDSYPSLHPLDVLFDVEKLMRVKSEQPLSAAFEKLTQAIGLYDHWIDVQGHIPDDREEWGQHAVQSVIWSAAGCEKLAAIEEDIVTLFTETGGDDNNTIVVALNRAYRRARQGEYRQALASLLEPDVWRGILLTDYTRWSWQIWQILALRASRRGQLRFYDNFLIPRRPPGPFNPRDHFKSNRPPISSLIREPLFEAMELRNAGQPAHCVEYILKSLWHAEYQFRFGFYRTGMILLADIGLEFGMTKRSKEIVENILPQVISGDDLEQRALACVTFARCTIAAGERSPGSLRDAIHYLQMAERDYAKIEGLRSLADVQYLLSVVYHNLGMEKERDDAASRNLMTEAEAAKEAEVFCEDWISDVWELHCDVGAVLARR
ncbi:hypothetical protein K488DRAFT_87485 [Vararia minispora EC-137]|uniref:Uncharacterized protein n=1 Tax=Vararia minispora EC-137 TaxID=1314806 RepID=A0ACB8QGK8_9AGAM|nr:hypothetical protein K488DRAFT_87485 [Vararia minispora EC-137]